MNFLPGILLSRALFVNYSVKGACPLARKKYLLSARLSNGDSNVNIAAAGWFGSTVDFNTVGAILINPWVLLMYMHRSSMSTLQA